MEREGGMHLARPPLCSAPHVEPAAPAWYCLLSVLKLSLREQEGWALLASGLMSVACAGAHSVLNGCWELS